MVLQVLADPGQVVGDLDPAARSTAPGPMPESCNNWGEPIEPAARITSRAARTVRGTPFRS